MPLQVNQSFLLTCVQPFPQVQLLLSTVVHELFVLNLSEVLLLAQLLQLLQHLQQKLKYLVMLACTHVEYETFQKNYGTTYQTNLIDKGC